VHEEMGDTQSVRYISFQCAGARAPAFPRRNEICGIGRPKLIGSADERRKNMGRQSGRGNERDREEVR